MKTKNEEIAQAIIQADLLHQHLLNGLNTIGVDAHDYSLDLQKAAFQLLGFDEKQRTDDLYDHYQATCGSLTNVQSTSSQLHIRVASQVVLEEIKRFAQTNTDQY